MIKTSIATLLRFANININCNFVALIEKNVQSEKYKSKTSGLKRNR